MDAECSNGCNRDEQSVLILKHFIAPHLLAGIGSYSEAEERSHSAIRELELRGGAFSVYLIGAVYGNLAYINLYSCTVTHEYNFAEYMKKSVEYYKQATVRASSVTDASGAVGVSGTVGPPASDIFKVADVRSYACIVGEGAAPDEFDVILDAAKEASAYIAETPHKLYYGYDDLLACEIEYFKYKPDAARNHANSAVMKARGASQISIEVMAEQYLLRIATLTGDYPLARELLNRLAGHLDNMNFWSRQLHYDLIIGLFFINIGLPELTPRWFAAEEKDATSEVHLTLRELVVSVKYHIALQQYDRALASLCKSFPREPHERTAFGELTLTLLLAVARIKTGDAEGANADFVKAYQLSYDGVFVTPFIELGKNLRPLTSAALKRPDCPIPVEWLKSVDLKASIYLKKTAVIMKSYMEEHKLTEAVRLSERELSVLKDLYHGLSRDEIAANQYLSINTVKKILQSVFAKLDAKNSVDAIRIAIEKNLVD